MTTAVATQAPKTMTALDDLKGSIVTMRSQIETVLPKHVSYEKFQRIVFNAFQTTPKLVTAERNSVFKACLDIAATGLMPDGREAAIVPFGDKAQAMIMVGGLLKLIRNSGELSSISPHAVFENDEFDYWVDENGEHLKHRPTWQDQGKVKLFYCLTRTKDGGVYIDVMSVADVEAIRKRSRSGLNGPWVTDFNEMGKKTVIRRQSKRLPSSTDLDMGLHVDDDLFMPPENTPETGPVLVENTEARTTTVAQAAPRPATAPRPSRLSGAIAAKSKPVEAAQTQPEPAAEVPPEFDATKPSGFYGMDLRQPQAQPLTEPPSRGPAARREAAAAAQGPRPAPAQAARAAPVQAVRPAAQPLYHPPAAKPQPEPPQYDENDRHGDVTEDDMHL